MILFLSVSKIIAYFFSSGIFQISSRQFYLFYFLDSVVTLTMDEPLDRRGDIIREKRIFEKNLAEIIPVFSEEITRPFDQSDTVNDKLCERKKT